MIFYGLLILSGIVCLWDWAIELPKRKQTIRKELESSKGKKTVDPERYQEMTKAPGFIQFAELIFVLSLLVVLVNALGIELLLVAATVVLGVGWLLVYLLYRKQTKLVKQNPTAINQQMRVLSLTHVRGLLKSTFIILLVVVLLRSFLIEPFRVPTGSLKPTIKIGDFIAVNKYDYGLRVPVSNKKFLQVGEPKVGDIVVFHWPPNPKVDYIKRVVGVPGDRISYINKVLYVNGKQAKQKLLGYTTDTNGNGNVWKVAIKQEDLNGIKHNIYIRPDVPAQNFVNLVVPKGYYFMMGDNRDDSLDSRYWGFVPEKDLVGKAFLIWMSWRGIHPFNVTGIKDSIRWHRLFKPIH